MRHHHVTSLLIVFTSLMQYQTSQMLFCEGGSRVITAAQMRAARALLGIDQKALAERSGVSLPTIQRMEASEGNVRGVVDTLMKVIEAFDRAGVELIGDNATSQSGGRGVRF